MVVTLFSSAPKSTIFLKATVLDLLGNVPTFVYYKWQPFKSPQLYHGICEIMTNTMYTFVITYPTTGVGCNTYWGKL